ncbi:hypothetical protein D3C85_1589690 [compost metagenome]
MPGAQRHPYLRIVLEPTDTRPMPRARVDDDVWPPGGIDGHSWRRLDPEQSVIDRAGKRAPVGYDFGIKVQDGLEALRGVIEEAVAPLAQRIPE